MKTDIMIWRYVCRKLLATLKKLLNGFQYLVEDGWPYTNT
jgi:hypothetical protein